MDNPTTNNPTNGVRPCSPRQSSQRLARVLRTDGSTLAAEQRWSTTDRIEIEGREKPAQSAEEIDDYAFYGCKALVRPKLSPSVRLGRHVFE